MSKLWGARFDKKSDPLADLFTFSISYDHRLARYDVIGSIAHARMLAKQRIIPQSDAARIIAGLKKILKQIKDGRFKFDPQAEDIHTDIQNRLKGLAGAAAEKLHTARSRNDQVVLDMKLYCRHEAAQLMASVKFLQKEILGFAGRNKDVIIPAYTHLQAAQVVLLAHHMLAYIEMLERDRTRLVDAAQRCDTMPLGSCALSGTSLKTDRAYLAKLLGFSRVAANSMDVVSDRDFIVEMIGACAMIATHLSRIAEDLILWASREFDLVDIDGGFCTGSSIMPHKKNPDVLELIRGSSSKVIGRLAEIHVLLKGLPLTYNRDLQLDKPALFESVDTAQFMLLVLSRVFATLKLKKENAAQRVLDESFFTVDAMDYLVKKGVSYRQAHDILGRMVRDCLDHGKPISSLSTDELIRYSPLLEGDVKKLFNPRMSVKIKSSSGSTNPGFVGRQLKTWGKKLHA
ncbi:MAG: argininosuccinate lyase [Candidatus Omnitrophica bacterium]|nr:argininosuccinate lyase [Candidatus Omnitrophota bacterium]MDE2009393.1 argininosuccinate lyase [Candidatus Omnitrophota bacterium]MDE2214177.1 argininosuccinate lyase [Candidatus Omnitrophota bacterium]MDE2231214.1 argininosuccinate lyase [Candidatus Omnitrophota bacterium]